MFDTFLFWCCLCWQYCGVRYSGYCWCWMYWSTLVCGVLNTARTVSMTTTSTEGPNTASTGNMMSSAEPRVKQAVPAVQKPEWLEYSEYQDWWTRRYFECSQHILSKYCLYSKYLSSPPESSLLQHPFVGPSVNSKSCLQHIADEIIKRRCTGRWSRYASYAQYTANIESILVLLRVPVLAVPTGRNTATSWQYPQYRSLKYFKYSSFPQHSIVQY